MPEVTIQPTRPTPEPLLLQAPIAKSSAIRALLAAALAGGGSLKGARGPLPRDVKIMIRGLEALGATIQASEVGLSICEGIQLNQPAGRMLRIEALDAGTPARFLVAAAALTGARVSIAGTTRLSERPLEGLLECLEAMGATIEAARLRSGTERCFPITVQGPLRPVSELLVDSGESSQFLSALWLIAPALGPGGRTGSIRFAPKGPAVSAAYLDLSRQIMSQFGVTVSAKGEMASDARYAPCAVQTEADWSGASILLAACAFAERPVFVPNLNLDSAHPDRGVVEIFRPLGLSISQDQNGVLASGSVVRGGTFDMRNCPDGVPAVVALAALAPEPVEVVGVQHLRLKESDRLTVLAELLRSVGAEVSLTDTGLRVSKPMSTDTSVAAPTTLSVSGDHRMAMVAALLGMRRPVLIGEPECVDKSFPGFFDQWPGVSAEPSTAESN